MDTARHPLSEDLDHVLRHTEASWSDSRGQHLFITGGTGFFGMWLLETFVWANEKLGLGARATVLTRHPNAFRRNAPHLADNPAIQLRQGDVRDFEVPEGRFSHVVHGAAVASTQINRQRPLETIDTIVRGTSRVLDFAHSAGTCKFLYISSGAVYGRQPSGLTHIPEDYAGGPDPTDPSSAYGEGKRLAELLCILAARGELEIKIARPFAFVGPYLPLHSHYAIGNFISDALSGGPISVNGDGTPYRSYMYAADLAIWLWTILFRGRNMRAYNVGSDEPITIARAAHAVASVAVARDYGPPMGVQFAVPPAPGQPTHRYVPSVARARQELGLCTHVALNDAIGRTLRWYSLPSVGRKYEGSV